MDFESPPFVTLVHERGGIPVVKVSGELDLLTAPRFRSALETAVSGILKKESPGVMVVDLSGVGFMDSSGINALVGATREFAKGGGEVRIVVKASPVARTLAITGLDKVFEIYPDLRSASDRGVA